MESNPKPYRYDPPHPSLFRLFKLNFDGQDGDDLSGGLLSLPYGSSILDKEHWKNPSKPIVGDDRPILHMLRGNVNLSTIKDDLLKRVLGGPFQVEYVAVSYTWGPQDNLKPLHLSSIKNELRDGKFVRDFEPERNGVLWITPSLHSFLSMVKKKMIRHFFWIDAICIDQNSIEDKNNQIPRMRKIYEHADFVLVWLGDGTSAEKEALEAVPKITEKLLSNFPSSGHSSIDVRLQLQNRGLPAPDSQTWKAIRGILTKPYWQRLWCLQEIVVATHDNWEFSVGQVRGKYIEPQALIYCGDACISWEELDDFGEALGRAGLKRWVITGQMDYLTWDHLYGLDALMETRTCRESFIRNEWAVSLSALLISTRRRQATNPADMVLGMFAVLDSSATKELALDVQMPTKEVFTRFGKYYIRNAVKECLLNHNATREIFPGLPSWCPNFASPETTISIGSRWFGHYKENSYRQAQLPSAVFQTEGKWAIPRSKLYRGFMNYLLMKTDESKQYNTSNPRQIQLVSNTSNILASGLELDIVSEVIECNSAAATVNFLAFNSIQETAAWDERCFDLTKRTLPKGSPIFEIYARTVVANRLTMDVSDDVTDVFDRAERYPFRDEYRRFRNFMHATIGVGEPIPREGNLEPSTERWAQCFGAITRNRKFFATKGGRIGIGPANTQVGDFLVVIFYCPTPYLIRKSSTTGNWKFVGEIFVNGLMYGEALDMLERGQVRETKWVIE